MDGLVIADAGVAARVRAAAAELSDLIGISRAAPAPR
jgi:hypothetical protein